jgi:S-formylglutathione hydrolase FrmB
MCSVPRLALLIVSCLPALIFAQAPATAPAMAPAFTPPAPAAPAVTPPPAIVPVAPDPTLDDPNAVTITFPAPGSQPNATSSAIVVVPSEYGLGKVNGNLATRPAIQKVQKRYPVIYLLHGYAANYQRWYMQMRAAGRPLSTLADRYKVIFVCVDGKPASWYLDAPADSVDPADWQIETTIVKHLIPEVDRRFRTWAQPEGRGVTGMSMGGHGAIYLTARHPDLFAACTSMSGILDMTHSLNKGEVAKRLGSLETNRDRWVSVSAMMTVEAFVGRTVGLMLDCGWEDPFFQETRELHDKLIRMRIPHTYVERPGAHNWDYWANALPFHVQFLTDRLKVAGAPVPLPEIPAHKSVCIDGSTPGEPTDLDIADLNGDKRPDIVVATMAGLVWYENPSWQRHVINDNFTHGAISCAAYDIDGDGKVDVIAAVDWRPEDTRINNHVWWTKNTGSTEPWPAYHVFEEPNIHRVRWVDVDGDGRPELVVAPQKGVLTSGPGWDQRGVRLRVLGIPKRPETDHWHTDMITDTLHFVENVSGVQFNPDTPQELLVSGYEGATVFNRLPSGPWRSFVITPGENGTPPNRGCGDAALGRLRGGQRYLATIEPVHGGKLVVYLEPTQANTPWTRLVVESQLGEGHGLVCADINGDKDDEILVGSRAAAGASAICGLRAYAVAADDASRWTPTWIDRGISTQAIKVADLSGDGKLDIVAIGRETRNVVAYVAQ